MSRIMARRVFAAGLLLATLLAVPPAEAAGPGDHLSDLLDRAWRWLASAWADAPAAPAPRGIGLVYDADGGHIDPDGRNKPTDDSDPTLDTEGTSKP